MKFLSMFYIKIDGQPVPQEFIDSLNEVVVDTSLYMPSMFTISLNDPDLKWVDNALLALGKPVEISVKPDEGEGGTEVALIKGEITGLEPNFSSGNICTILVRGYTKDHRLHRGKKIRTFLQKKDSDIASTLAGEAGLQAQVDATTVTYDHLLQYDQTNMEFLQARAARIGYQVFAADGKLYFKKGEANLGDGPILTLSENLIEFQPCLASTHQADTVTVRGWDSKQKQAIVGTATPNAAMNQGGQTQTGGAAAQSAFSAAEFVLIDHPVFTQSEATELAKGLMNDLCGEFIQAEGVCEGEPGVKAGWKITITGVGTRFSGKYFVTSATHIYKPGSYETHFTISGRHPNTVNHLLEPRHNSDTSRGLVQGVVVGLVTNLNDPDDLGRVKVKYAWLGEIESWWAKLAAPMAGPERGIFYLPEVNDEVLIAFEHGDVHRPYIIGSLWSSTDKPPKKNSEAVLSGKVNQRIIKTRAGHLILLDDKSGEEKVQVKTKAGHEVMLDDTAGSEKISIKDKTGNNTLIIDSAKNDISMTCFNNITLKCNQKLSIDCTNLDIVAKATGAIKANASLKLEGPMVSVNGSGTTEVKGGAMVQIQGAMVKIN